MWYSGKQPTSRICAPDDCSSSNLQNNGFNLGTMLLYPLTSEWLASNSSLQYHPGITPTKKAIDC